MITGIHTLIYAHDADKARAFFRDVLGFKHIDAGHGWLIFALPPAELGIHPAAAEPAAEPADNSGHGEPNGTHTLSLMADDIHATVADLKRKGVEFTEPITDHGWGIATKLRIPGGGEMALYQPRHPTAIA